MSDMRTPATFSYNVDTTAEVVEMAHAVGVSVEGELGCLGSLETGLAGEEDGSGSAGQARRIKRIPLDRMAHRYTNGAARSGRLL